MTTIALENVLAKAGLNVNPSKFLALVEDAARRLTPPSPNPSQYFSPDQQAALRDVGLDLSPQSAHDTDYRARTVAAHAVLADSALTVSEAAALLGVDDSRIRHRLKEGRLTGWKAAQGGWRLPAWQFTPSGVLPGLDVVLRAVPADQPALVVAAFMSTAQSDLVINGRPATPRQWLLAGGDPELVAPLASTLGTPF
ncbi:DNA-binding protein [Saccharomonospora piscinae]|uniref:DNA-binding protein n=1 Tax=Saccharomonospora piscinae TaxID=687388 RepID=A0A1V9A4I1_SACPI|nr:DNA-binding protein [Saccharomonospora piscinae]OQO91936.1 DNA-binding protein [Saccharomonospora piscinae]TLW92365.1 DNA-binding protein [Saccharomonospora piscinae]